LQYHYTLKQINKKSSFSVHAFPSVGLMVASASVSEGNNLAVRSNNGGLGGIQIPIFVNYNSGIGASFKSKEDFGYTIGLGLEYIKMAIISLDNGNNNSNYRYSSYKKTTNIVQPAMNIGYRYLNSNDNLREWNLKFGYLPKKTADAFGNNYTTFNNTPSWWLRLSLTYYLDGN
jgi:opacity protein-like surface antigen